jgi:CRISPR locus-related DNA-binding protein
MQGIGIAGYIPELLIGPFYSKNLDITEKFYILYTEEPKSLQTVAEVDEILSKLSVDVKAIKLKNIFDFYEVYFTTLNLASKHNIGWVNATAGPGIAMIAISFALQYRKNVKYIYYHRAQGNIPATTDVISSYNVYLLTSPNKIYLKVMEQIYTLNGNKGVYIEQIAEKLNKSESTISRKLNTLLEMRFIDYVGSGRGNSKKVFTLTSLGIDMLKYINDTQNNLKLM